MKICTKCNKQKPLADFYLLNKKTGRCQAWCKACESLRSRARKDYHKAYRIKRFNSDPEFRQKYSHREEKDPIKDRCRNRTRYAVKTGKIKKLPCVFCNPKEVVPHHPDYSDHLTVIWMCQLHHRRFHLGELVLPRREA